MELTGQFSLANVTPSQPRQSGHKFGSSTNDLDRALSALNAIPPDLPHDDWVKVGMALQAAGGTFDDFDQWSDGADSYNAQDCRAAWKSFKPGKGINAATLFHIARGHCWTEGTQQPAPARAIRPAVQPRKPAPGRSAAEVWERCEPADKLHYYIFVKDAENVPRENLRVVPDGDSLHFPGYLVVPAYAPDGSLQSLQFVPPKAGKKITLRGTSTSGAWFTVGKPVTAGVTYICEGVATAWSCYLATGDAAVSCFGSSNMEKVAHSLRQRDPSAMLVLVPDRGMESKADQIATEIDAAVAYMPDGEDANFDANDFAQRNGLKMLALLLADATKKPKPPPETHPLASYVDIELNPKAVRWVIPGFIGHGVVVISGSQGVGKTTAILPLAMVPAGLHAPNDPLAPLHWRHVVYIAEELEQAQRILAGIIGFGNLGLDATVVRERLHMVEARRLQPTYVAKVGAIYCAEFTRNVDGVDILPLVVIDTKSAVLEIESENDNSEASAAMAALKQGFAALPVWLIGHLTKADFGRTDIAGMTSRGAGAWEADANQTLFLIKEKDNTRHLVSGKKRFETKWPALQIDTHIEVTTAPNEFGGVEPVTLRWGIASPPTQGRTEAAEQAQTRKENDDEATLRQEVRDAIETAWQLGNPLNREGVKAKIKRNASAVVKVVVNLVSEQWIYDVSVPAKERAHPARSSFLINLNTVEHEALLRDGVLPDHKLVVPKSWKKQPIPPIPDVEQPTDDSAGDIP